MKLKAAQLHYAVAAGPWQKREWKSIAAEVKDGRVTAKLPADRPLVYYLAVTDERGPGGEHAARGVEGGEIAVKREQREQIPGSPTR